VNGPGDGDPVLDEAHRRRAIDPNLFQLVFYDLEQVSLNIETYDSQEAADAALAKLEPDEYGEGGGLILSGGSVLKEKLFLKYMLRDDYVDFFKDATKPPSSPPAQEEVEAAELGAIAMSTLERVQDLITLAPGIAEIRREYPDDPPAEPDIIYGKPSQGLVAFAEMYPGFVKLGGCCVPPPESL